MIDTEFETVEEAITVVLQLMVLDAEVPARYKEAINILLKELTE